MYYRDKLIGSLSVYYPSSICWPAGLISSPWSGDSSAILLTWNKTGQTFAEQRRRRNEQRTADLWTIRPSFACTVGLISCPLLQPGSGTRLSPWPRTQFYSNETKYRKKKKKKTRKGWSFLPNLLFIGLPSGDSVGPDPQSSGDSVVLGPGLSLSVLTLLMSEKEMIFPLFTLDQVLAALILTDWVSWPNLAGEDSVVPATGLSWFPHQWNEEEKSKEERDTQNRIDRLLRSLIVYVRLAASARSRYTYTRACGWQ